MNNNEITKSYINGFVLSTLLTLAAYFIVVNKVFDGGALIVAIIMLALVQLSIQLIFFLHILQEPRPHWNLFIVLSTISIILVIIIGSLWIMNNLNYNHLKTPGETNTNILLDEGLHK